MEMALNQVEPGMVTDADVRDRMGRVLVPAGTSLDARKIKLLKAWGIVNIDVYELTSPASPPPDMQSWLAKAKEKIDPADLEHGLIIRLLPIFAEKLAGSSE